MREMKNMQNLQQLREALQQCYERGYDDALAWADDMEFHSGQNVEAKQNKDRQIEWAEATLKALFHSFHTMIELEYEAKKVHLMPFNRELWDERKKQEFARIWQEWLHGEDDA